MVLSRPREGAVRGALPSARCLRCARGSQALEFALVVPAAVVLLVMLLHAGMVAADLVTVQGLAREAARAAALGDDADARGALLQAAGRRPVTLTVRPAGHRAPGGLVTAEVRLRSAGFSAFGVEIWLPAAATMRVEDR